MKALFRSSLLLCLTLVCWCAAGTLSAFAQTTRSAEEDGRRSVRILLLGGYYLTSDGEDPNDTPLPISSLGVQTPLFGPVEGRVTALLGLDAKGWNCPIPRWIYDEGFAVSGIFDLALPLRLGKENRFALEAFAGTGLLYLSGGKADPTNPDLLAVSGTTKPLVTLGIGASYRVSQQLELVGHLRGVSMFVGEQDFTRLNQTTFKEDLKTANALTFFLGFAYRL